MVTPIDPTSAGFLLAENRNMPMHVGGLQLFEKPEGAGPQLRARDVRVDARRRRDRAAVPQAPAPLAPRPAASWSGRRTSSSTSSTTSGTARCPSPAGSASCSTSAAGCTAPGSPGSARCGRPTSSRGCATAGSRMYTKTPPRPRRRRLGDAAARRACSAPTPTSATCPPRGRPSAGTRQHARTERTTASPRSRCTALRTALGITAEAAGMPSALVKTLSKGLRNETSALSLYAPRTIFNQKITGSRRFAAQDWPIERLRAIGKATGTTLNDVVLAMCGGARAHLPARARRAPRGAAGRDGAGRPQRQAVARRLRRGRQRGRLGHGASWHRQQRPRRPARSDPPVDEGRQGGAVEP